MPLRAGVVSSSSLILYFILYMNSAARAALRSACASPSLHILIIGRAVLYSYPSGWHT